MQASWLHLSILLSMTGSIWSSGRNWLWSKCCVFNVFQYMCLWLHECFLLLLDIRKQNTAKAKASGCVRDVAFPVSLRTRRNETESAVFLLCMFPVSDYLCMLHYVAGRCSVTVMGSMTSWCMDITNYITNFSTASMINHTLNVKSLDECTKLCTHVIIDI